MKRRNSKLSFRNPSPINMPFPVGSHRVPNAAAPRSDSRVNKDSSRKKRLNSDENASGLTIDDSLPRGGTQALKPNGPKTSEYAFFKKLKTDSSQRFHSQSFNKEEYRSKKSSSSECYGDGSRMEMKVSNYAEGTDILRRSSRDFRPISPVENCTHMDFDSFLSPVERAAKNSQVTIHEAFSPLEDTCSIEKWMGKDCDGLRSGDIFSRKRQKLRQWVADCSFPEIYELCSKGTDFVSLLLSRLYPSSNEKNNSKIPESWPMEINTKSKLLSSPEQDIHFRIPSRNLAGAECMLYLENDPSSYWSDSLSEDMVSSSDPPTCYARNTFLQNNLGVPSCQLGGRKTITCIESEATFGYAIAECESPPLSRHPLKELYDFHDSNGFLLGREPPARLLEWDSRNMRSEKSLAIACQNTYLNRNSSEISSWDRQEFLNNEFESFGAHGFCASSVLGNYPRNLCPSLPSHSPSYQHNDHELKEYILEENEDRYEDSNHLPLTLSCAARCPFLTEDCCNETKCNVSESSSSPGSRSWSIDMVSNERNHSPGNEALLSNGLDVGRRFLSLSGPTRDRHSSPYHVLEFSQKEIMSSHLITEDEHWGSLDGSSYKRNLNNFTRGMIDIHGRPSSHFHLSLETEKSKKTCPLLLENSSWEEPRGEKYNDDDEIHGFDASVAFGCGRYP